MENYEIPEELRRMREREIEKLEELDDLKEKVNVGKIFLAGYAGYVFGKNSSKVLSYVLTGVMGLTSLCEKFECDFKEFDLSKTYMSGYEEVNSESVSVLKISDKYEVVFVEPNDYVIFIGVNGELQGVNISKERTPFVIIQEEKRDRKGKLVSLEERLEIRGKPLTVYEPEKAPSTNFRVKRKK